METTFELVWNILGVYWLPTQNWLAKDTYPLALGKIALRHYREVDW